MDMRAVITSLKSKIDANIARLVIFLSLSVVQLVCSVAALDGVVSAYVVFAIFIGAASLPLMYERLSDQSALKHFQIFYIMPLLISVSLTYQYGIAEYLLQIVVMVAVSLLCFSEVGKCVAGLRSFKQSYYLLIVSMAGISLLGFFLIKLPSATKFITLITSIIVYLALEVPGEKLLTFRHESLYEKEKSIFFVGVIIFVYAVISFTGNVNFLLYLAYVVSVVNLGFSFRNDKVLFLIFSAALLLASLIPFGPREIYVDSFVMASIVMLFYLKSPILYFKDTKYGEVRVDYSYHSNKIYLLIDGIIQGERSLSADNRFKNLRCFGSASNNSVVSSIFDIVPRDEKSNIAVLGLGSGILAMFGREKQLINFYEINPEIVKIAYDRRFFDYLGTSKARTSVILGDARDQLSLAESKFYNLIFVDVYLGGDIPSHFLTVEAVSMYFSKLKDNGVVALHITADESENIEPVISFIARHLKLTAVIAYERYKSSSHLIENKGLVKIPEKGNLKSKLLSGMEYFTNIQLTSDNEEEVYSWVVLGRNKSSIKRLLSESRWHVLDHRAGNVLYTDEIIGYKERKGEITQEVD